jgi:hypothetical protein
MPPVSSSKPLPSPSGRNAGSRSSPRGNDLAGRPRLLRCAAPRGCRSVPPDPNGFPVVPGHPLGVPVSGSEAPERPIARRSIVRLCSCQKAISIPVPPFCRASLSISAIYEMSSRYGPLEDHRGNAWRGSLENTMKRIRRMTGVRIAKRLLQLRDSLRDHLFEQRNN